MMDRQSEVGCALLHIPEKLMVYSGNMHTQTNVAAQSELFSKVRIQVINSHP